MNDDYKGNFYHHAAWIKVRSAVWAERKGLCEDCLAQGIYKAADVVHHIKPITPDNINDPRITINKSNLCLLCHNCHNKRHKSVKDKKYVFNRDGSIAPLG